VTRWFYSKSVSKFLSENDDDILNEIEHNHNSRFRVLEGQQMWAYEEEIKILKRELQDFPSGHLIFEYTIPRMGKRVDVILIVQNLIFVIEFKTGTGNDDYQRNDINQCIDYALDLKNFHEESHTCKLIPILVSSNAAPYENIIESHVDGVFKEILCNSTNLKHNINKSLKFSPKDVIDIEKWKNSRFKPTPTIIEAAQVLYRNHDVTEIRRNDAEENLEQTSEQIKQIITLSKEKKQKSICFITGVPGAGKTLAGLNIANETQNFDVDLHAVFLSGNEPLVDVLREALAKDLVENSESIGITEARRRTETFIQNIHHYRDEGINNPNPLNEKVVIFDEAQRAYDLNETRRFLATRRRNQIRDFNKSEPEHLISVLDRHSDFATIICLIGGGQEINRGEGGVPEWFSALKKFSSWKIYLPKEIDDIEYTRNNSLKDMLQDLDYSFIDNLHLKTSIRSFRSKKIAEFVKSLLEIDIENASKIYDEIKFSYPIYMTRNILTAKKWIKEKTRGTERCGIIASSGARRLFANGIYVKNENEPVNWFLKPLSDVRSSNFLEITATEFEIQGLELDWGIVGWDADFRFINNTWNYNNFKGGKWNNVNQPDGQLYLKNAYRVLLTRARQGLIIFIPEGNNEDYSRQTTFYDGTYSYLKKIGIEEI
tara:strand:- start:179 stop:2152 length:1974 start_codon:yes stop_codon:yes gene_type:complete